MTTLSRHSTRLLAILPLAALLAAGCDRDSIGPSGPSLLADRRGDGDATASGFAVLANQAVTCTDGTITGDVGTFQAAPTGSVTQTTCPITGTVQVGTAASIQAFNAFLLAYTALAPQSSDVCPIITGTLAGQSLAPGIHCLSAEAKTGVLTLTGSGPWTFKVPAGALTGTNFSVVMADGGQPCNVTWWVDAAATMTDSDLKGSILAGAAITLTRGTFSGNAWSKADVTITGTALTGCAAPGSSFCNGSGDRVTGGGWISGPSGAKATFGVSGGIKNGRFSGNLSYDDRGLAGKADDVKVKSSRVTAYTLLDAVTRRIEGRARMNGRRGFTYRVDVSDNGEPGGNDVFAIRLWNASGALVYSASGTLQGGNIKLHRSSGRACKDHDDDDHDDDDNDDDDDDDDDGHGD
ncbi:MAG TPA: post-COAP-1 domain-containing protein [Gemmatimonadales bacterium]